MTNDKKRRLFEIYQSMTEMYEDLKEIMRRDARKSDYERARAYWLGNISNGIGYGDYVGSEASFEKYLMDEGIIDENKCIIEGEDFDMVECDGCGAVIKDSDEKCKYCGHQEEEN